MRILLAEDEKSLNRVITRRLSWEGYSVDSCFDGREALDYLAETYGMETVIRGNLEGASLAEICGKDYPELYADCVAYLAETYGPLLAAPDAP